MQIQFLKDEQQSPRHCCHVDITGIKPPSSPRFQASNGAEDQTRYSLLPILQQHRQQLDSLDALTLDLFFFCLLNNRNHTIHAAGPVERSCLTRFTLLHGRAPPCISTFSWWWRSSYTNNGTVAFPLPHETSPVVLLTFVPPVPPSPVFASPLCHLSRLPMTQGPTEGDPRETYQERPSQSILSARPMLFTLNIQSPDTFAWVTPRLFQAQPGFALAYSFMQKERSSQEGHP